MTVSARPDVTECPRKKCAALPTALWSGRVCGGLGDTRISNAISIRTVRTDVELHIEASLSCPRIPHLQMSHPISTQRKWHGVWALCLMVGLWCLDRSHAGCCVPQSDAAAFGASRSVAEVEVLSSESFFAADRTIRTRFVLNVVERFKGDVPDQVEIESPGGVMGERTDFRSDSLALQIGKSYVLLLNCAADGTWSAQPHQAYRAPADRRKMQAFFRGQARGARPVMTTASAPEVLVSQANSGVPGSVVTATGYIDSGTPYYQPARLTACDGGDAIPYLVDVDPTKLPTGMTQAGAIAAVAEAFNAWAAESSLKFRYEGTQSFGAGATTISAQDRRLRIQLHDNYNIINTTGTLGIGGGAFYGPTSVFTGGRVGSQGFQERLNGYVVLESTTNASSMLITNTFKRVLTHEIGHALGLAHSSENASEPNATLKAATMYYSAQSNSTGATIQIYDKDRIQFGYPMTDTPPYGTDRIIQAITADSPASLPAVLGVNRIQLRAMDRQGTALTASLTSSTNSNGTFSFSGLTLTYVPKGAYSDIRSTDSAIEAGAYYDRAIVQFSDGVNLSRALTCIITGFSKDTTPTDGLPDAWMTTYFGSTAVGAVGSNRHPDSDPDRDGLSNRVECYLNTNPNLANSGPVKPTYNHALRQISYTPVRFAPYWIESSSTLESSSWILRRAASIYQSSGTLMHDFSADPMSGKTFYRVVTGP